MIQMSVSDQIITVLDDLCKRFGIVIDWSSENIMPYLQDIVSRFMRYEILTSITWCVVGLCVMAILCFMWKTFEKRGKKELEIKSYSAYAESGIALQIAFWIWVFICVILISCKVMNIIACATIPEKVIFDYVSALMRE